jgi:uncharacterized protein (TIGR03435 family)
MQEWDDSTLLRAYVEKASEEAFATLVARHVSKVYSVALRHTGSPQHAEEITQAVFVILARKSRQLGGHVLLSGWLYQAARLTAVTYLRSEIRRARREQEAHAQNALNEEESGVWPHIAPLLDEAMASLNETDRHAVVLRFFDGKSIREVGAALGANESAARKRVDRALEKLQRYFSKHGVTSTAATLTGLISTNSVQAAPTALARTATTLALAKSAAISPATPTLVTGALKLMAWTKMKTALVAGLAALLAVGTATLVIRTFASPPLESYFTEMDSGHLMEAPPVVLLRPSKYAALGDYIIAAGSFGPEGKLMRRGATIGEILSSAYGVGLEKMVLPAGLPKGKFDLLLTLPERSRETLRAEIKKKFGLVAHSETRDRDVLVMKKTPAPAPGLTVSADGGVRIYEKADSLALAGYKMSGPDGADVVSTLAADYFNEPVVDETGLTETYNLELHWNGKLNRSEQKKDLIRALREQAGLDLVADRRPVEMLVVEHQEP